MMKLAHRFLEENWLHVTLMIMMLAALAAQPVQQLAPLEPYFSAFAEPSGSKQSG